MISIISFTANGSRINRRLQDWFLGQGIECEGVALARYAAAAGVAALEGSYKDWCREKFPVSDTIIFISAAGIAVRGIAPYVKDKKTDPAVLVIDEQANFVISLLSGHIGGANEVTEKIAAFLNATPVITTGTDVNHTFAVDVFATKNELAIESMTKAKELAAWIIDKKQVRFYSELPVDGKVPAALTVIEEPSGLVPENELAGLARNNNLSAAAAGNQCSGPESENNPSEISGEDSFKGLTVTWHGYEGNHILRLIPKCVHLGIGCKRDTPLEKIEALASEVLAEENIDPQAIASIASIDLKKDEAGLIGFAGKLNVPFRTYTAEELKSLEGEFTPSKFVGSITGVDNVCERAAAFDAIVHAKDGAAGTGTAVGMNGQQMTDAAESRPGTAENEAGQNRQDDNNRKTESASFTNEMIRYNGNSCRIVRRKTAKNGVTVAIAVENRRVYFG